MLKADGGQMHNNEETSLKNRQRKPCTHDSDSKLHADLRAYRKPKKEAEERDLMKG